MAKHANEHFLDVDFETARSLHRVVRGMHDGECPKCHHLHESPVMRRYVDGALNFDLVCPNPECGFTITAAEQVRAIEAFAPVMAKNLAVFEKWRAEQPREGKQ